MLYVTETNHIKLVSNSICGDSNVPIIRKIIAIGKTSKAVILPKSWLRYYEAQVGHPIDAVAIKVNKVLQITPLLKKTDAEHT